MSAPSITFAVDDVVPATTRLPESHGVVDAQLGRPMLASGPDSASVDTDDVRRALHDGVHGLIVAIHTAFSDHRPLVLSPDAMWLTIAQGFAIHVRENAEQLRDRFVRHAGRKTLQVQALEWRSSAAWHEIFASFAHHLGEDLGRGVVDVVSRPFSTTGPDELAALRVVLMETFERYYDYEVVGICGIPSITLRGSPDDWRDLRTRVEVLCEYDLAAWAEVLLPVCDQWIATAEGRPDRAFWQAIYKPEAAYGDHVVSGWILRLFPYVDSRGGLQRNPFTKAPPPVERELTLQERLLRFKGLLPPPTTEPWAHQGVLASALPGGVSRATVRLSEPSGETLTEAVGGFLGVAQQPDGLAIEPRIGWAICEVVNERVWEKLAARLTAGTPREPGHRHIAHPALLMEFQDRFPKHPVLDGELSFRTRDEIERCALGPPETLQLLEGHRFADLPDGSFLAYATHRAQLRGPTEWLVAYVPPGGEGHPECIHVIARSLLELFQKLAEPGPLFFRVAGAVHHGLFADLTAGR